MKRIFSICCLLVFAFLLYSCGNAKQEKLYLEQDEYGAYQGDEYVTSCVDLGYLADRCQFDWIGSLFDIPIEDLNTKRGIHIGSTLDEIATAYEGIHFSCSTQDIYDESIETLVQNIDTSESFEITTWTYFETRKYMLGEGVPVSDEKELSELKASGACLQVQLIFKVQDAVVTDLILFANEK